METLLWESKAVCLRAFCGKAWDDVYLTVLRILEASWRAYSILQEYLRKGVYADVVAGCQ